jgi:hypothetical protein
VRLASSDTATTEEAEPDEAKGHEHAVGEHSHAEEEHTSRPGIAEAAETAEALQQDVDQAGNEEQSRSPVPKVATSVMAEGTTAPAVAAKALQQGVKRVGNEQRTESPATKIAPPVIAGGPTAPVNVAAPVVDDSGTRREVAQPADRTPSGPHASVTAAVDIPSEGRLEGAASRNKADDRPSPGVQRSAVPAQHHTAVPDNSANVSPPPSSAEDVSGTAVPPQPKPAPPPPMDHSVVLDHDDDVGIVEHPGATTNAMPKDPRSQRHSPCNAAQVASADVDQAPTSPTAARTEVTHAYTPPAHADAISGSSQHPPNQQHGLEGPPVAEARSASSDEDATDTGPVPMTLPEKESVDPIEGPPTATLSYSPQADHHAPIIAAQSDDPLDRLFSDLLLECDPRFSINLTDESLDEILGAESRRGLGHGGVHIPGILPRAPAHEVRSATSASNDLLLPTAVESSQPRQPNPQQHDLRVTIATSSSPSTAAVFTTPSPPGRHTPSIMASRYLSASNKSLRSFSTDSSLSFSEAKRRSPRSAAGSAQPATRSASPHGGKKTEDGNNTEAPLEGEHRPVAASRPAAQTTVAVKTPPRELQRRGAKAEVTVTPPQAGGTENAPRVETVEPPAEPHRVFMVHGISRRRFTEDEVTLLATLPQPLHVTHVQDHAKFIVGYEHAPEGNRVTSEGYLTLCSTSAPECTFQLVAEEATYDTIVDVLGSESSSTVQSATLRACFIAYLPSLRLFTAVPRLIELDLSGCGLAGRLPGNSLPRTLLRLDVSHNQLTDCSGVMACTSLQELNIGFNYVETVHALPKTLVRLNLECNLIWDKVCLRIVALCALLQSACLDGNPITVLVRGWAAFLRSMAPQLLFLDGRKLQPPPSQPAHPSAPQTAAQQIKRRLSPPSRQPQPTPVIANSHLSPKEQRLRDEERALQHQFHLQEVQRKREEYLERLTAARVVKPEHELLQTAQRLSAPKLVTPKRTASKKAPPSSFGRSERMDLLPVSPAQRLADTPSCAKHAQHAAPPSASSKRGTPATWTRSTALKAVGEWTQRAAECLESAAVLINRVDDHVAKQARPVTTDDVQAFQRDLVSLGIAECDPLPFTVKLALSTLHNDVGLVSTITRLHEKLRDYGTVLNKLEAALSLCASAAKSFGVSFHIIMHSEAGRLISAVPKEDAVPAQNRLHQARERLRSMSPASSVALSRKSVSPSERKAMGRPAGTPPPNGSNQQELGRWKSDIAETSSDCAALLKSVTDRFTLGGGICADTESSNLGLAAYVEGLKQSIIKLQLDRFDAPPAFITAAAAKEPALKEALQALRSYKSLFAQVENMLFLCSKGGIAFDAAFQVLMNSAVGRAVKKALHGAPGLTIVAPKPRSPALPSVPSASKVTAVPATGVIVQSAHAVEETKTSFHDGGVNTHDTHNTHSTDARNSALQALLAEETFETSTALLASASAALNESFDQLEFNIVDPNEEVVQGWLDRCECVLGRAAVSLNSAVDLAHSGHPLTKRVLADVREDHASIDISSCEPPPKAVAVALQTLSKGHPLFKAAWDARSKLDTYDDLFSQVESAMKLCFEHKQDFGYAFDLLMRTDVGLRANRCMHGVYDYSEMYE